MLVSSHFISYQTDNRPKCSYIQAPKLLFKATQQNQLAQEFVKSLKMNSLLSFVNLTMVSGQVHL